MSLTLIGTVYVSASRLLSLEPASETDYLCQYGQSKLVGQDGSEWAYFSNEDLALLLFPEEGTR